VEPLLFTLKVIDFIEIYVKNYYKTSKYDKSAENIIAVLRNLKYLRKLR
jgi:hypothetical protein